MNFFIFRENFTDFAGIKLEQNPMKNNPDCFADKDPSENVLGFDFWNAEKGASRGKRDLELKTEH